MSTTATANPLLSAPPRRVLRTRRVLRRLLAALAEARDAVAEARRLKAADVVEACGPGFDAANVEDDAGHLLDRVLPASSFNVETVLCWLDSSVPAAALGD